MKTTIVQMRMRMGKTILMIVLSLALLVLLYLETNQTNFPQNQNLSLPSIWSQVTCDPSLIGRFKVGEQVTVLQGAIISTEPSGIFEMETVPSGPASILESPVCSVVNGYVYDTKYQYPYEMWWKVKLQFDASLWGPFSTGWIQSSELAKE